MDRPLDTTTLTVRGMIYAGVAEAYGFGRDHSEPCSMCGSTPAAVAGECDRADCPLEGAKP